MLITTENYFNSSLNFFEKVNAIHIKQYTFLKHGYSQTDYTIWCIAKWKSIIQQKKMWDESNQLSKGPFHIRMETGLITSLLKHCLTSYLTIG